MAAIPERISETEKLTHAIFAKDDVTYNPFWVRHKSLLPTSKNPNEVSFSRACYIPDNEQKALCYFLRPGKKFAGFVALRIFDLNRVLDKLKADHLLQHKVNFPLNIFFKYTPIYEKGSDILWPEGIEKVVGNGYNPAHADLYFDAPTVKNDPNIHHTAFAYLTTKKDGEFCSVFQEGENNEPHHWRGPILCE